MVASVVPGRVDGAVVTPDLFADEAARIGRALVEAAIRDGGRATWLADELQMLDGAWQPVVTTLDGDLAGGTAGVGWFLLRYAAVAGDRNAAAVGEAAVRHALDQAHRLTDSGRLGWYQGTLGVAWAAIDGGLAGGLAALAAAGADLARAVARQPLDPEGIGPALLGGSADRLAGLVAAATALGEPGLSRRGAPVAARLAGLLAEPHPSGMAAGQSGANLTLRAWQLASGAAPAFADERAWWEPDAGWLAAAAHEWLPDASGLGAAWCSGAAGIGSAQVAAHLARGDLPSLADVGTAVEQVRAALAHDDGSDASLCHGSMGGVELLLAAGAYLGERSHLGAARRAAGRLVEAARRAGGYGVAFGPGAGHPSLLYGLAGVGLTMLRLADGGATPSVTLPDFLAMGGQAGIPQAFGNAWAGGT